MTQLPRQAPLPRHVWIQPSYLVVFKETIPPPGPFRPLIPYNEHAAQTVHMLDLNLKPALKALWFCLHLPALRLDYRAITNAQLRSLRGRNCGHQIVAIPSTWLEGWIPKLQTPLTHFVLVIADDEIADAVKVEIAKAGWDAAFLTFSELDPDQIPALWSRIGELLNAAPIQRTKVPEFCNQIDFGPLLLPTVHLWRRAVERDRIPVENQRRTSDALLDYALFMHAMVSGAAALEERGLNEEQIAQQFDEECVRQRSSLSVPVTVVLPGLPKRTLDLRPGLSERLKQWHAWDETLTYARLLAPTSEDFEKASLDFLAAHRACATTGVGISLNPVSFDVFGKVGTLEDHFRAGARKPSFVWKTLWDIGSSIGKRLSPPERVTIGNASSLTVFSVFPFGWTILEGESAPLLFRVPIVYRTIFPLTRAFEVELYLKRHYVFSGLIRVLLVEALQSGDPIRQESLQSLRAIRDHLAQNVNFSVSLREVADASALRAVIAELEPDILLISAHGMIDRATGAAGIIIGSNFCVGPELGRLPHFVILSACHTSPRGGPSQVNVAELLLTQGPLAVLTSNVAIHVRRNAFLMERLFLNLAAAKNREVPWNSVAEVWHHTATTNVFADIMFANPQIERWAFDRAGGSEAPVEEVVELLKTRLIATSNVYEETEKLWSEIMARRSAPAEVKRVVERREYIPETLFYFLIGLPEQMRFELSPAEGKGTDEFFRSFRGDSHTQ
jgi:hypothetical protein